MKNRECILYKFDYSRIPLNRKQIDKVRKRIFEDAMLQTNFRVNMINTFSGTTYNELIHDYVINRKIYKKKWLLDVLTIGLDMINEKHNVRFEYHWDCWYVIVPKELKEIIQWVEENKPYYVKIKKKVR